MHTIDPDELIKPHDKKVVKEINRYPQIEGWLAQERDGFIYNNQKKTLNWPESQC